MVSLVRLMRVSHYLNIYTNVGDNYVISQQTARTCLKYSSQIEALPSNAAYISKSDQKFAISDVESWRDSSIQLSILESRARHTIFHLAKFLKLGVPWKNLNIECVNVS